MSTNRSHLITLALFVSLGSLFAMPSADTARPGTAPSFEGRVLAYTHLRQEIADRLRADGPEACPTTAPEYPRLLAAAIRDARRDARVGDIVGSAISSQIQKLVRTDMLTRPFADRQAILADVPRTPRPRVNDAYPDDEPMATVPPRLLMRLAPLPSELQYRFLEDAVILLDVDANLIVDVVPNALGRS